MGKELKHGQMDPDMKATTLLEGNMESDLISGMMVLSTLEIGMRIKSAVLAYIHGLMVVSTKESGKTTTWRD